MTISDLLSGVYDQHSQQWVLDTPRVSESAVYAQLSVATLNVWFADIHFGMRCAAILELLRAASPDIITLQEVTPALLNDILHSPWIQAAYRLSDIVGTSLDPYGVLILSRLPIHSWELVPLATAMGRQLVIARAALNGMTTAFASVHLESKATMASIRIKQMQRIFPALAAEQHVILTGDFNFDTHWDERQYLDPSYQDCWPLLHPYEPGFTVDTERNHMRLLAKRQDKQTRFDRIFLRSSAPGWQLESIELLGDTPISSATPDIFPSDHFGLLAQFISR